MHYKDRVLQGFNNGVRFRSSNTLSAWNQLQRPEYSDRLYTPSTLLYTTRSSLTLSLHRFCSMGFLARLELYEPEILNMEIIGKNGAPVDEVEILGVAVLHYGLVSVPLRNLGAWRLLRPLKFGSKALMPSEWLRWRWEKSIEGCFVLHAAQCRDFGLLRSLLVLLLALRQVSQCISRLRS